MVPTTKTVSRYGAGAEDVYSAEFERRRIYLTGEINDAVAADIRAQINHLAAISGEDITLIIDSPGGSVTAGLGIYDTMKSCGCDVSTVVTGIAASMGAVLASSGTKGKRWISRNSEFMIHQPLGGVSGQASDIERSAVHIIKTKQKLNRILAENADKDVETVSMDCDRDYYLDAEESVRYGLCDGYFEGFTT